MKIRIYDFHIQRLLSSEEEKGCKHWRARKVKGRLQNFLPQIIKAKKFGVPLLSENERRAGEECVYPLTYTKSHSKCRNYGQPELFAEMCKLSVAIPVNL